MAEWNRAKFVRYVANNTDSEQMIAYSSSEVDERKFVDNACEYLGRFWGTRLDREYPPAEWMTKERGRPMAIDLVRCKPGEENKAKKDKDIEIAIEAKFITPKEKTDQEAKEERNSIKTGEISQTPKQIIEDVFRLLSLENQNIERYLLVGGRRPAYNKIWEHSILQEMLPREYDNSFGTSNKLAAFFGISARYRNNILGSKKVNLEKWAEKLQKVLADFKESAPHKINFLNFDVELVAIFCPSGDWVIPEENTKDIQCDFIDVRLWQIKPSK